MMEINQKENELHLYPVNNNEYIGAINMNVPNTLNFMCLVVVLDFNVLKLAEIERFITKILPLHITKLGYSEDYEIDLIIFSSETNHCRLRVTELRRFTITGGGGTYIAPAISMLQTTLQALQRDYPGYPIRVLTISDGYINDSDKTEREIKKLTDFLDFNSELTINSQVVTPFRFNDRLETKTLSYLLQINNSTTTNLSEINDAASNEMISNSIGALFQMDSFQKYQTLQVENSVILKFPWNSSPSMRILLVPGWNIFWLKAMPTGTVKLGSNPIRVKTERQLSLAMFYELMETKLKYIADHMTILKIVDTLEANRTVDQIFSYFSIKEDEIARKSSATNNEIITNLLDGIARRKPNFRDYPQMVEFFRKINREIDSHSSQKTLVATGVQTVFVVDENVSGTKKGQRFNGRIIQLMLSKLFYENSQIVHLVTFVRYKMNVGHMLQSILQTLDAKKRIQICVLTSENVRESMEIEDFADTLVNSLSGSNFSFELQVVRLPPNAQNYEQKSGFYYCCFSFIIFIIIAALLTLAAFYLEVVKFK